MGRWKKLTEKEFELIKTLQKAGIATSKICSITERKLGTVRVILRANSLQDYYDISRKYRAERAEARKSTWPKVSDADYDGQEETPIDNIVIDTEAPATPHLDNLELILVNLTEAILLQATAWEQLSGKLDVIIDGKRPWSFVNKR